MNGGWSEWGSWSSCDGETTKTRARQCNNPAPSYDGAACAGPPDDEALCPGIYFIVNIFKDLLTLPY